MKFFKQTFIYTILLTASLFLFSCSKDDDGNDGAEGPGSSVSIEDGRIAFDISGIENASMKGDAVYYLSNSYDIKYFNISNDENIIIKDRMWNITIEQNSTDEIALPEPGEYPLVKGLANTYDQNSFSATVSMYTDTMTDEGTHFGGNNGEINGTLRIISKTDNIVKGTFSFDAYTSDGEKITVTNGQFAVPKNSF